MTILFFVFAFLLGCIIGSFLNVIAYRLPMMLQREWQTECETFLKIPSIASENKKFNLCFPASHCPQCQHKIAWYDNIPLFSYLLLGRKCRHCQKEISSQYFYVELITGITTFLVVQHIGMAWQTIPLLFLTWALIVLTVIDLKTQLLPDSITLFLLWLGLLLSVFSVFVDSPTAIIGAAAGYFILWFFAKLFQLLTGKIGMGHGDFKLCAALSAWLGFQGLPLLLFFSAILGSVVGISLIFFKKQDRSIPIPFGPYLALVGWILILYREPALQFYQFLS